ncbi:MAG TPA: ABC transporter permease subunit, partial [Verrucomicrobiae bacterium]|nr:ABC transporter permease subunit [Verrucomicrobiae bacterium]
MSDLALTTDEPVQISVVRPPVGPRARLRTLLWVPAATLVTLAVHLCLPNNEPANEAGLYSKILACILAAAVLAAGVQFFWIGLKNWMGHMCPILAAAILTLCGWELITGVLHWLPLPYFPAPGAVFQSMVDDRALLLNSTWHSLALLLSGYTLGVLIALITGVCIGWSTHMRYWGMPLLKVIGPIPATAWIPLAMVLSPSTVFSSVILIALAVWFPVTMLTISGIANTRASYLDVARTLGGSRWYLIFRVAIPAAMPNIFVGLFMG